MVTWKLILEYDGTRYSGWQEQKNARTVAGEIRAAARDFSGREVEIHGSGRTDAGVHALAQVAHMRAEVKGVAPPLEILRAINSRVPADIAVLEVERVPNRFHARHDALTRTYLYQIATRKTAFAKRFVWWIKEDLDLDLMAKCASKLPGRHDFVAFRAADHARPDESTIVVVESANVERHEHLILFHIEASHFLWRMVRRVAGVLVKLGTHEIAEADFEFLLSGETRRPRCCCLDGAASGLFLESVQYR